MVKCDVVEAQCFDWGVLAQALRTSGEGQTRVAEASWHPFVKDGNAPLGQGGLVSTQAPTSAGAPHAASPPLCKTQSRQSMQDGPGVVSWERGNLYVPCQFVARSMWAIDKL